MRAAYFGFVVVFVLSCWPQIVISLIGGFHPKKEAAHASRQWEHLRGGSDVAGQKPRSRKQKLTPACVPTDMRLAKPSNRSC